VAITVVYAIWIGGPYLRSIVVRDAAVTTWLHAAAAPIPGVVADASLGPGDRIGADGRILTIDNARFDDGGLARASAAADGARARQASLARIVKDLEALTARRATLASEYTAAFRRNLDAKISGMQEFIKVSEQRLALERAEANRAASLTARGIQSASAADAAAARVADIQAGMLDVRTQLDRALLHRSAAGEGLLMLDDASEGASIQRSLDDARLQLERARADAAVAAMEADAAARVVEEAARHSSENRTATVTGEAGGLVWSRAIAAGSAVQAGPPVATWIDCRVLLVDAAVSDLYLPLIGPGAPADVVFEGERHARRGTVVLLRGAAATLGGTDLAAIAKGRRPGLGQALVRLEPTGADAAACPVGRAAFVNFPGVNVIDVVRARLRW
jgi:multidrug resistance efflux pump